MNYIVTAYVNVTGHYSEGKNVFLRADILDGGISGYHNLISVKRLEERGYSIKVIKVLIAVVFPSVRRGYDGYYARFNADSTHFNYLDIVVPGNVLLILIKDDKHKSVFFRADFLYGRIGDKHPLVKMFAGIIAKDFVRSILEVFPLCVKVRLAVVNP